jgi:uncharacterized iron-regulated membrane protein
MPNRGAPKKIAWHVSLSRFSRRFHSWAGAFLGLIMVVISVTGMFVAFKEDVEYLQPESRTGTEGEISAVIPPAQVADAVLDLNLPEARTLEDINRIELRPADNMFKVRLEQTSKWESPREIQVDAIDGEVLNTGVRGDQLWLDIHSFAVFDSDGHWIEWITMVLAGLSLLWLTLSGYYMFFYPYLLRRNRAQRGRLISTRSR